MAADPDRDIDAAFRPIADATAYIRPRARIVGSGLAAGGLAGALGTVALGVSTGDVHFGVTQVFALGALALGFGVLGWSGSVLAGQGIESMQHHLGTGTGWTESDSRRAMARIAGFGAGVMLAVTVIEALA